MMVLLAWIRLGSHRPASKRYLYTWRMMQDRDLTVPSITLKQGGFFRHNKMVLRE